MQFFHKCAIWLNREAAYYAKQKKNQSPVGYHDSTYITLYTVSGPIGVYAGDPDIIKTHLRRQVPRGSATVTTW